LWTYAFRIGYPPFFYGKLKFSSKKQRKGCPAKIRVSAKKSESAYVLIEKADRTAGRQVPSSLLNN